MTTKLDLDFETNGMVPSGRAAEDTHSSKQRSLESLISRHSMGQFAKEFARTSTRKKSIELIFGKPEKTPLSWLLPCDVAGASKMAQIQDWHATTTAYARVHKRQSKKMGKRVDSVARLVAESVGDLEGLGSDIGSAFSLTGAAYAVRMCIARLDETAGRKLIQELGRRVASFESTPVEDPWLYQIHRIELPLVMAFQFSAFLKRKDLAKPAFRRLQRLVTRLLDAEGWPKAEFLDVLGPLVASFSRSCAIAESLDLTLKSEAANQLQRAARNLIRLSRPKKSLMLGPPDANSLTDEFLKTLLRLSCDPFNRKIARASLSYEAGQKQPKKICREESSHSEWAEAGAFQRDWKRKSPKCAFTYDRFRFHLEVCRRTGLVVGDCTPQVTVNGAVLKAESEFVVIFEENGDLVDYLELEIGLGQGVTLRRQLIFGKRAQFLVLSDVIRSPELNRIDYQCEFPLAPGIEAMAETETCEYYLKDKKIRSLVLPLALPEWKIAPTDDTLVYRDGKLVLVQSAMGRGMFAGLFFDLSPQRSIRPRTWRSLTVAEALGIVDADIAVAFRIQIGPEQWVLYRSIGANGNRSFLGENVTSESYMGRFERNGEVTELMQIG